MKFVTGFLILVLATSCSGPTSDRSIRVSTRAVYLVQEEGQLLQAELDGHPEILVTHNFEDFKKAARQRIGLWIDKNATQLVEEGWPDTMPQASYPIVLIGNNDPMVAFGFMLQICCFLGHIMTDEEYAATESGFSVIERESGQPGATMIMVQGYNQAPVVADILKISNDLLDGKVTPMPSPIAAP